MVRVGERVLIADIERGGKVAVDTKSPVIGKKVLVMDTGESGKVAVRALNVYERDEGLVVTLPCGSKAFLPSEPPDYFSNTPLNESGGGMGCGCSQGAPETNGWICAPTCGFRAELGRCSLYYGYSMNPERGDACGHAIGANYWRGNTYIHDIEYWYGCPYLSCPNYPRMVNGKQVGNCGTYNSEHYARVDMNGNMVQERMNCTNWAKLVKVKEERTWWFSCTPVRGGATCPYYNGGRGQPTCNYGPSSPPPFQPGDKPPANICQNPGGLSFTGWEVPGGSNSNEIRCAFSKATEGHAGSTQTSSGFGDDQIRCQFSVF